MRRSVLAFLVWLLSISCTSTQTITILHFSDYHSHAAPFFSEGERDAAGIARAVAYLEPHATRDDTLVFSGGDMLNRGAPPWSDKYRCTEWPWLNGIVDAMAFGNHDADYGSAVFSDCRDSIDYPILSANATGPSGIPIFMHDGKSYVVFERRGVRIGVFALAGSTFEALVTESNTPVAGVRFAPRLETAREVVRALREEQNVDAVVLIGHADTTEDEELARRVPGIDLILGTHSHIRSDLRRIEGTATWMISPWQYLGYISRVEMTFDRGRLTGVRGELVRMGHDRPEDPELAERVASMQRSLKSDPQYAPLFEVIGHLDYGLSFDGINEGSTPLGTFVMDVVRQAAEADVALSTSSSFRGPLPPGVIVTNDLLSALPYDNAIVVFEMSGGDLGTLLRRVASLRGTDSFCQMSGGTIDLRHDGAPIDPDATYTVATTDYLAKVSSAYRDLFRDLPANETGRTVRSEVRDALRRRGNKDLPSPQEEGTSVVPMY